MHGEVWIADDFDDFDEDMARDFGITE